MEPVFISNFFPKEIVNLLYNYCVIKYKDISKVRADSQANSIICEYSDPLMETLLDMSTPVIEQNVGKKLWPVNTFFRIYDKESDLPIHKDRKACEYTVTICLGCDPVDKPYDIFLGDKDENSDYRYLDTEGKFTSMKVDHKYSMKQNDALIMTGWNKYHWREWCKHDHYAVVFLHYVDQNGDFSEYKFDKRKMLGLQDLSHRQGFDAASV